MFALRRNLALEQRMTTVEESIERAGAQLTQIVTAAKVPLHYISVVTTDTSSSRSDAALDRYFFAVMYH